MPTSPTAKRNGQEENKVCLCQKTLLLKKGFEKLSKFKAYHVFYKKLVYKKLVLSCSKSYDSSALDFPDLRNFFSVYVLKIRFICVNNAMYVILATLQQFNFCYFLKFIVISNLSGAFSLSINVRAQNIGTQKLSLRMSLKSFDIGIVKSKESFSSGRKNFHTKTACFSLT